MGTGRIRRAAMRLPGTGPSRLPARLAVFLALALIGCDREFQNPFLPQSDGYAGSAWSRDADGNGVADSVEKYAPGCAAGPAECLRLAREKAGLQPGRLDSIVAEDLNLLAGGPPAPPRWRWYPAALTGLTYTLVPDDPTIAAVDDALIRPLAPGVTAFTLTARTPSGQERAARFTVKVSRARVPVTGIRAEDLVLAPGESRLPEVVIEPADATDTRYEILTHDPRVAIVRQGMVVGVAAGRTLLTVRTLDGGGHEALFEAVVHRKVESVTARPLVMLLDAQPQAPLLEFLPADATDKGYALSGGDARVAVITVDGKIQPVGPGTTRMTATVEGGLRAEFPVTVQEPVIPVESVKVQNMDIVLFAETDDRIREPTIAWTPANATNKGYTLSSDNPSVVRVVGGSVEVLKQGEAKVTLVTDDGKKKANFKVKVTILIPCGVLYPCEKEDD
jgi:hypothetical protein